MSMEAGAKLGVYTVVRLLREDEHHAWHLLRSPRGLLELMIYKQGGPPLAQLQGVAEVLQRIEHQHISETRDVLEVEGCSALAYDYVEGNSLNDVLGQGTELTEDRARGLMKQMVEGLEAAHQIDVVHGALSGSKVMLAPVGSGWQAQLSGFVGSLDLQAGRTSDIVALAGVIRSLFRTVPADVDEVLGKAAAGEFDHASSLALALWPDQDRPPPPHLGPVVVDLDPTQDAASVSPKKSGFPLFPVLVLSAVLSLGLVLGSASLIAQSELEEVAGRYHSAHSEIMRHDTELLALSAQAVELGADGQEVQTLVDQYKTGATINAADALVGTLETQLRHLAPTQDGTLLNQRQDAHQRVAALRAALTRCIDARSEHEALVGSTFGGWAIRLGLAETLKGH